MKLHIEIISPQPLEFSHELPLDFPGPHLPGGEVFFARVNSGYLSIQEFDGESFMFRYSILQTEEPFQIRTVDRFAGVHAIIMMRNDVNLLFETEPAIPINQEQFSIFIGNELAARLDLSAQKQYICFEAMLSFTLADSILFDFPELSAQANSFRDLPKYWVNPAKGIDDEVREQIRFIFTYSDPEKWRRNNFRNKAWNLVWKLVALHLSEQPAQPGISKNDREKVYEIQRRIVDNLDVHTLIKDLAQGVLTNQSHLKKIFSQVYGMGIHEYRIYERLKKAIQLISEGMTVKEAARHTGWQATELGRTYFKLYGTTPGTLKKKKK